MEQRTGYKCWLWAIGNSKRLKKSQIASKSIISSLSFKGKTAIILGSGLGDLTNSLGEPRKINYSEVPYFNSPSVAGHDGTLYVGYLKNEEVLVAKGRLHLYEGYPMSAITFPIKVFRDCGVNNIIITNSAGSLDINNEPGKIMIVNGILDCTFRKGSKDPKPTKDCISFCPRLISLALDSSKKSDIDVFLGYYCWTLGPAYETSAEVEYLSSLGGKAVGMSALPEVIEAGKLGLNTLTLSVITNFAAGINNSYLSHDEVLKNAFKSKIKILKLISGIISKV